MHLPLRPRVGKRFFGKILQIFPCHAKRVFQQRGGIFLKGANLKGERHRGTGKEGARPPWALRHAPSRGGLKS